MAVVAALSLAVLLLPAAASASGWSPATRLTTSTAPFSALAIGAFAQPNGTFVLSGYSAFFSLPAGRGSTTGAAGGAFPAPVDPALTNLVTLPDGTSIAAWGGNTVQQRAANGAFLGSPQFLPDNVSALGADASGNATAAGVLDNNTFELHVATRPFGDSSFTEAATPVATSAANAPITLIGLVVDPDGAADVTWVVDPGTGSTIWQATRAAGAASFGAPTMIASDGLSGATPKGISFASNAAGRALLVYADGTGYAVSIREPGGAFGAAPQITGALARSVPSSAAAVAADGSAAVLVSNDVSFGGCGTYYSLRAYRLGAGDSNWTPAGTVGGSEGDSVSFPALAGGPGDRIDAAWSVDTRSGAQECGADDHYEIDAGTLGGSMTPIFSASPPSLTSPTIYGNRFTGGFAPKMALNACGDGALIVGIADSSNTDAHDGLFTSTTTACPPGGGGGDGGAGGGNPPPPGGTGPTAKQIHAALLKQLSPAGKPAKIAALLKRGGYALTFKALTAGIVTISWYLVPHGAHVAKKTAKPKPVLVASGKVRFTKASSAKLTVKLTSNGRKLLTHAKRLKLTAKGTFTPVGKKTGVVALATFTLKR
jgi:hypothetical protein